MKALAKVYAIETRDVKHTIILEIQEGVGVGAQDLNIKYPGGSFNIYVTRNGDLRLSFTPLMGNTQDFLLARTANENDSGKPT